jgi:hypothetical protein
MLGLLPSPAANSSAGQNNFYSGPYALRTWLDRDPKDQLSAFGQPSSSSSSAARYSLLPRPTLDPGLARQLELSCSHEGQLSDAAKWYHRVLELGFVRGMLLPVRNALGDAARVGALLEEGPGPYKSNRHSQEQVRSGSLGLP